MNSDQEREAEREEVRRRVRVAANADEMLEALGCGTLGPEAYYAELLWEALTTPTMKGSDPRVVDAVAAFAKAADEACMTALVGRGTAGTRAKVGAVGIAVSGMRTFAPALAHAPPPVTDGIVASIRARVERLLVPGEDQDPEHLAAFAARMTEVFDGLRNDLRTEAADPAAPAPA